MAVLYNFDRFVTSMQFLVSSQTSLLVAEPSPYSQTSLMKMDTIEAELIVRILEVSVLKRRDCMNSGFFGINFETILSVL